MLKKKIRASFQRIIELFTEKFVAKLWVWDPGSGKTYSGSRIRVQGAKRHRIPDPDRNTARNHKVGLLKKAANKKACLQTLGPIRKQEFNQTVVWLTKKNLLKSKLQSHSMRLMKMRASMSAKPFPKARTQCHKN
jgi:hypothetical protein